jgi:eukaryotic-like serine/threonine-protein kinase
VSHDGPQAVPGGPPGIPGVMTFPAPAVGEVLVNRYRLEEHIGSDTTGRQIWRAVDGVLNRAVALVIRQPGGDAAASMLTAAVAASRLAHPHLVAVYDAIDERHRAYVVREWIPGISLRDVLLQAPLDAERSVLVTHAITEAVAALHAAGIVHGNVGPSAIIIADDGRVVLTDPHPDDRADVEFDVRAIGAVLYACLTGHWPSEFGPSTLPDARRDGAGRLVPPRQVRGGIPPHLDEIASDLLSPQMQAPAAAPLAAEFARLATQGMELEYDDGPIGFADHDTTGGKRRAGGKLALGVAMLAVIAVVGAFIGARVLGQEPQSGPSGSSGSPQATTPAVSGPGAAIPIRADQVRVVDPPTGDRQELAGIERVVDGKDTTGWASDEYNRPNFGGLKPGMGILVNLGTPTNVASVRVVVGQQGATLELRTGPEDFGNDSAGDEQIAKNYTSLSKPAEDHSGTVIVFPVQQDSVQYLLVWVTKLPPNGKGKFAIAINEIAVNAR